VLTLVAVALALVAACFFAAGVRLQHRSVQTTAALGAVVRSPSWLGGTAFAVAGSALHLTALSLAPLAIVQPIGVLSLVLTVLVRNPHRSRPVVVAMAVVCAGIGGFVLLSASAVTTASVPVLAAAQPAVLLGGVVAVVGSRGRCLAQAAGAAVLFGLGAAVGRAAALHLFAGTFGPGLALVAEAGGLLLAGGWLLHRAYATGPAAIAVAATTVLDPLTAVVTSALLFGERPALSPAATAGQAGLALVAVAGVAVLARSLPDQHPVKEHPMPAPRPASGLRVLVGADTYPPDVNGAAHFADRLVRGLAGRGHDVHVLTPEPHAAPAPDAAFTRHHTSSRRAPFHPTFRFSTPRAARRTAGDLLDRLRPDVVHVQSHFSVGRGLLAAARERDIPTVATNHFMPENLLGYVTLPKPLAATLTRWAWRDFVRVYRRADLVTTPTPRAAQLLEDRGFPGRALVVSCGIDLAHYAPDAERMPGDDVRVLFVGRLDAEKHVDDLIRALAHAPDVRAEIVGDGSCRTGLQDLAERLGVAGRVTFHGLVSDDDLLRAYRDSDIFCMPGTAELQSLATMEAMAAGLPVLAADAMALPHLVYSGLNGYLYEPGDVGTLGAHLAALAGDPVKRAVLGHSGRTVVARHGLTRTLETFEDLYRTIARMPVATPSTPAPETAVA
jgi:glycosyltransferase involved in cell wall biosynthesis